MFDKAKRIVDITPSLRAPMPAYKVLADGLTVTEERATAWFRIKPSSTQMATAKEMDAELTQAIALAQKVLRDRTCHIKIVWGRITGDEYATSAAVRVAPDAEVMVRGRKQFVSRGGHKLQGALDAFGQDVRGMRCLDAGASTGGFTDCLLQAGAASVAGVVESSLRGPAGNVEYLVRAEFLGP